MHALQTDKWLAVRGSDSIFALGDAATIVQDRALEHAAELFVQVFCTINTTCITVIQCCLHMRSSTAQGWRSWAMSCSSAVVRCVWAKQAQPLCQATCLPPLHLRCFNSASQPHARLTARRCKTSGGEL